MSEEFMLPVPEKLSVSPITPISKQSKAIPMEPKSVTDGEGEEEYVLLDFESVSDVVDIPPGAPYVLSGLDTLHPMLVIDSKIKLVGHYKETIGTCIAFSENGKGWNDGKEFEYDRSDVTPDGHLETGPSEANLFEGRSIEDTNQVARKEVKPVASLTKILKFRLLSPDIDIQDETYGI